METELSRRNILKAAGGTGLAVGLRQSRPGVHG